MPKPERDDKMLDKEAYDFNPNHSPCKRVEELRPASDVYIIWRGLKPTERTVRDIVRPNDAVWVPNCALVVKNTRSIGHYPRPRGMRLT